jgi:ABC-2 type transport system ATP-binding protein
MSNSAIAVSGLRKAFGDKAVLDGIDLDVPAAASGGGCRRPSA